MRKRRRLSTYEKDQKLKQIARKKMRVRIMRLERAVDAISQEFVRDGEARNPHLERNRKFMDALSTARRSLFECVRYA